MKSATTTVAPARFWRSWLINCAAYAATYAAIAGVCSALPPPPWAIDAQGNPIPVPSAHTEQGDFTATVTAPDAKTALDAAAEVQGEGLGVTWTSSTSFTFTFPGSLLVWFEGLRQRLTECLISCGCESRKARSRAPLSWLAPVPHADGACLVLASSESV